MITKEDFDKMVTELGETFKPLSESQSKIYFSRLREFELMPLWAAVEWLLENHKWLRFPMLAEIRDAYKNQIAKAPRVTAGGVAENTYCEICGGTGWDIYDGGENGFTTNQGVARYCVCSYGCRLKANNEGYLEKRGLLKRTRFEEEHRFEPREY